MFKIFDHVRARGIAAVSLRYRQTRQAGMSAVGVQMEPVIVAPPDRADDVGLFQDRSVEASRPKRRRRGETRWTGADDDGVAGLDRGRSSRG
jgi:hypothetical protein